MTLNLKQPQRGVQVAKNFMKIVLCYKFKNSCYG